MNKLISVGNKNIRIVSQNKDYYAHLYINSELVYTKQIKKDKLTKEDVDKIINELKEYVHVK